MGSLCTLLSSPKKQMYSFKLEWKVVVNTIFNFTIEVFKFGNMISFQIWKYDLRMLSQFIF